MAKLNSKALSTDTVGNTPALAELRALRNAKKEHSQKVEELKLRLFQITERHMDQAIRIMKDWVRP